MLKIGGGHDYSVHVLAIVEFFVVATGEDVAAREFLHEGSPFLTPLLPDIGNAHELEVQLFEWDWKAGIKVERDRSEKPTIATRTRSLASRICA